MADRIAGFGDRLCAAIAEFGPLCPGIDPHRELLQQWDLPLTPAGLETFADRCVQAWAGQVAIVKPQMAFFEQWGSAGIAVVERLCAQFRQAGTLVVLDAKRGDLDSTMAAYAQAYLAADSPCSVDALTVNPFLGVGALRPAFELAAKHQRGLFVLARTSNPEGESIQAAVRSTDQRCVSEHVVDAVNQFNAELSADAVGPFGVVLGAINADASLRADDVSGPILMPGFGAQGGTAADVAAIVGPARNRTVMNSSRALLRLGPTVSALRDGAAASNDELRAALAE